MFSELRRFVLFRPRVGIKHLLAAYSLTTVQRGERGLCFGRAAYFLAKSKSPCTVGKHNRSIKDGGIMQEICAPLASNGWIISHDRTGLRQEID